MRPIFTATEPQILLLKRKTDQRVGVREGQREHFQNCYIFVVRCTGFRAGFRASLGVALVFALVFGLVCGQSRDFSL